MAECFQVSVRTHFVIVAILFKVDIINCNFWLRIQVSGALELPILELVYHRLEVVDLGESGLWG
jgi:hypothetical protein